MVLSSDFRTSESLVRRFLILEVFVVLADTQGSELMWLVPKVVLLSCSSVCEHMRSIEDWIHSKTRNRLGQELVDLLVHTHTNLHLQQCLEIYETGLFPWDIEMTTEESLPDDEDGNPHNVSDSESESESENYSDLILT